MLNSIKEKVENELNLHPEKKQVYIEDFQNSNYTKLYYEAWYIMRVLYYNREHEVKRKISFIK